MKILEMSFSAAILILMIVIIRSLALHRLPKSTFPALWAVALCRMLIPFSISSHFSIYTFVDMLKNKFLNVNSAVEGVFPTHKVTSAVTTNTMLAETVTVNTFPFMTAWIIGLSVCALFFVGTHIRCRREYKTALPIENDFVRCWKSENTTRRRIEIRKSDRIAAPLTYGILRPVILLPKETYWADETKLGYILAHEFVHIRRFDTLGKLLLAAALCVHWFNPLAWVMYVLANRDIELSCDETVVRKFGEIVKSAYAMTLIGLEEKRSHLTPLVSSFCKNFIEERIVSIMKIKKTSIAVVLFAAALVIGTAAVFATDSASAADKGFDSALESNKSLSDEDIEKQKQERREDIIKCYSVYSKYGLIYDREKDRFFYNGQLVRFFADKLDEDGYCNTFSYTDGDVDLRGVRNDKYELTGIEVVSREEFNRRTAKIQASSKNMSLMQEGTSDGSADTDSAGVEADSVNTDIIYATQENVDGNRTDYGVTNATESGDQNYTDNSLNAYIEYGFSYDREKEVWMYQDKPIHLFYDEGFILFTDNSDTVLKDGLSLKAVRDAGGNIEGFAEMTETEINELFN